METKTTQHNKNKIEKQKCPFCDKETDNLITIDKETKYKIYTCLECNPHLK